MSNEVIAALENPANERRVIESQSSTSSLGLRRRREETPPVDVCKRIDLMFESKLKPTKKTIFLVLSFYEFSILVLRTFKYPSFHKSQTGKKSFFVFLYGHLANVNFVKSQVS